MSDDHSPEQDTAAADRPWRRGRRFVDRWNTDVPDAVGWVQRPNDSWRAIAFDLAAITVVTALSLTVVFRLWSADLRVPFGYDRDALYYGRDAKVIIETGWVQTTPRLGAPFGQQLWDFPVSGDNGHYALMRLMSIVTSDWALLLNGFLLFSFFTAGWAAYLALRWLSCGRISSTACALLFAFAPYHLARGVGHLMLASYFIVPIAVLVAVRAASGRPLIARSADSDRSAVSQHARCTVLWVLMCLACASFGAYYAVFAMVTIGLGCVMVAATRGTVRPLLTGASHTLVIAAMFLINLAPNLWYRWEHGFNPLVGAREAIDLDRYGLLVIQMITPVPDHRFGPLRAISEELRQGHISEGLYGFQYFGTVGAVALLALLVWIVERVLVGRDRGGDATPVDTLRSLLAAITLAWILIATVGGLSWLVWLGGLHRIHAWNRISIFLLFTSLCWLSLTVGPVARRWAGRSDRRRYAALGGAAVVVLFGLVDQTSPTFVPDPDDHVDEFTSDRAFFAEVEAALPTGSMVYVLPYRQFPEEPPTERSADYDLNRPFLHTHDLRFSYGGMKGRESDWQSQLEGLAVPDLVADVVAVGYEGILVDRFGYADHGAQLEADLSALTGAPILTSRDGRWAFVNLSGTGEQLGTQQEQRARREALLDHPRILLDGCYPTERSGDQRFQWCSGSGTIYVDDPAPDEGTNLLTLMVEAPAGAGTLTLQVGDDEQTVEIGPTVTHTSLSLPANDRVTVRFDTNVEPVETALGDRRDLRFRLIDPAIEPAP